MKLLDYYPDHLKVDWNVVNEGVFDRIIADIEDHWDNWCIANELSFAGDKSLERDMKARKARAEWFRWKCKTDLFWLCKYVLGMDDLSENFHRVLCDWMWATKDTDKRLIMLPRGYFKTSVVTQGDTAQDIVNDPGVRIAAFSGDLNFGQEKVSDYLMTEFTSNPYLLHFFPEIFSDTFTDYPLWNRKTWSIKRPLDQNSRGTRHGFTVQVLAPGANKTGAHYDVAKLDDPTTELNYQNPETRMVVKKAVDFLAKKVMPLKKQRNRWRKNRYTICGTPYHREDYLVGEELKRLGKQDFEFILDCGGMKRPYFSNSIFFCPEELVDLNNPGKTFFIFPEMFDETHCREAEHDAIDKSIYRAQMKLDITSGETSIFTGPFGPERFWSPYADAEHPLPRKMKIVIAVDPAGDTAPKSGNKKDETVIQATGMCPGGELWDLAHRSAKIMSDDEIIKNIVDLCRMFPSCEAVGIEGVAGGVRYAKIMLDRIKEEVGINVSYEVLKQTSSKAEHCTFISPWWIRQEVHINPEHPELLSQIKIFTGKKRGADDHIDAFNHTAMMLHARGAPPADPFPHETDDWFTKFQQEHEEWQFGDQRRQGNRTYQDYERNPVNLRADLRRNYGHIQGRGM